MSTTPVKVWTKLLGTSGNDEARALTTGVDGSIYVSGFATGALDGQTNSGGSDAFLTKYSADGTKAWTKLLGSSGGYANALTTGLDGSIYVGGFTPGTLDDGQTYFGSNDAFLTKYSADGTRVWARHLDLDVGGRAFNDEVTALTTGLDGSIYISGYSRSSTLDGHRLGGGSGDFLSKYSADGTKVWTKLLGASPNALTIGLDGSIYVSGQTDGVLDGQTYSYRGSGDAFLIKYSADGTKAWTQLLGTSRFDAAYALTTGLDGSIYVSGTTNDALDGQTYNGNGPGYGDAFLTKYSADGSKAWTKQMGTSGADYAYALTTGLDGSIYVSGKANGAHNMGLSGNPGGVAFLTKYSADGTEAWTQQLGTSGWDYTNALTTGLDGSIYVSGHTSGALDGQSYSGGAGDAFLTKYQVAAATYAMSAGSSSYNEGSTATFTLTTTNVTSGTSVPYTLSGVNAADVSGGSLSGNAVVNSSGVATISVTLLNDLLTEGAETLTVTAAGASASTVVNDTSKPSYSLQQWPAGTSANEGYAADFAVTTTGVGSGSALTYSISGSVNAADIATGSLTGQVTVGSNGVANISIPIAADKLTEGPETLTVTVQGQSSSITINDTSKTATYSLGASSSSVNEGSSATFTLSTTNVSSGTSVPYTLSGVSTADVSGGSLSGNAVVNSSGVATISVTLLNDNLTEGAETLTLTAGGSTASSQINDTSQTPSTFIQQVNVENSNTYWSYWYVNPTNWSNWDSPRITLTSTLTGNTPLKITAAGSINTDPYVHANDGQLYPGITNAAGIYVAGSSNGNNPGTSTRVPLNLPNGTLLNTSASWGALLIGNPEIGWTSVFNANSGNGLGSTNPPTNLSINTSLNTLIGRALPSGTVLFLTYNDQDNSNTGSYTVSLIDTSNNSTLYLVSSTASVNEGSTASFTLTTTNLTSGTSVPYTLSGISAADVSGGSLTGSATVNSSGVATISVTLLNDSLTEGAETLTVTAGGASASTVANDTSKSSVSSTISSYVINPTNSHTYAFLTGITSWQAAKDFAESSIYQGQKGYLATITSQAEDSFIYTQFVANKNLTSSAGNSIGLGGSDAESEGAWKWVGGPEKGLLFTYNSTFKGDSGTSQNYLSYWGSNPKWDDMYADSIINSPNGFYGFIIEYGGLAPAYNLSSDSSSYDEGTTATFTLTTTNVASGTLVPYTLSGINPSDVSGGLLMGNAVVNSSGVATISVSIFADSLTEGAETLIVTAQSKTASVTINDSSKTPSATYSLVTNYTATTEGTPVTATLSTTNVAAGTTLYYQITGTGITTADLGGLSLTGTGGVNSLGKVSMTIQLASDPAIEGEETFYLQYYTDSGRSVAAGSAAAVTIYDTSKDAATYSLSPASASIDEGFIAGFNLLTTNVAAGASVSYTIGGVSAADITGSLTGTATVGTNGKTIIYVAVAADFLTEGAETLTVTAQGKSATMTINDTSKAVGVAAYAMSAASSSVDEGSTAVFALTTSNVAGGTSIPYTVSGISATDVTDGSLSGVAIVNSSGKATIAIPIAADFTTEGIEELTLSAQGKSATMTINDTSKTAVTVRLETASYLSDAITNSPVSQNIDGGAGVDTLVYNSTSYDVLISKQGGSVVVTNTATGEVDTLINVERLKFADTAIALDTGGVGGQAYRVYKAAFNRTPDLGGLGYWISGMDGGASLKSVAQGFVNSPEFKAVYGASPTNAQIVTRFYDNVLGRAAESGGYNYWLGILSSGQGTVADVLAAFSESPENQAGVIGVIGNGILYTPYISPT